MSASAGAALPAGSACTEVSVNGQIIPEAAIAAEAQLHGDSADPRGAAATALVLRRLIIDRARSRGLLTRDELEPGDADLDDALDALLALEASIPEPTEEELRRFHAQNPGLFRVGERVQVAHILFEVRSVRLAEALQERAEAVLERCRTEPDYFAVAARELSNCPSGAQGGDLGWLSRGESVPEFERVIFAGAETGLWPRPIPTRFGWHLLRIIERDPGHPLPFEPAQAQVAAYVKSRSRQKAGVQYLQRLAAEASVRGVNLSIERSWLMQ
ncbi:MAG TPA: peptidylprolyl isomerase [Steroidobacteraceae bacterium]